MTRGGCRLDTPGATSMKAGDVAKLRFGGDAMCVEPRYGLAYQGRAPDSAGEADKV